MNSSELAFHGYYTVHGRTFQAFSQFTKLHPAPTSTIIRCMERLYTLASRCQMNSGDLLLLAREVAHNGALRCVEDLNALEVATLCRFLEVLLAPAREVERVPSYLAA